MFKKSTSNCCGGWSREALFAVLALACLTGLMGWPSGQVAAVEPNEILSDKTLEKRARDLSAELRCLVCQNQSIDDSNAPLARDLRRLVRERLTAGDSDGEVIEFIVARYGEFVLLRPPLSKHTIILWFAPVLILLAGIALARKTLRPKPVGADPQSVTEPLTEKERRDLKKVLKARIED